MKKEYLMVGQIINTHGIKGEIKIDPLTDDISRFERLDKIYMGQDKKEFNIAGVKYIKNFVILKLDGLDDINQAMKFKKKYLYIDKEDRLELPEDHYFIFDLIGCEVLNMEGNFIGRVREVLTYTSNDVYVIRNEETNSDYLIPARKEFVKSVDIDLKKIIIDPIEGMIE